MQSNVAASPSFDNVNSAKTFTQHPRRHFPPPPQTWLELAMERIPDLKLVKALRIIDNRCDENGRCALHVATLASLCGVSRSTFQRHSRELQRLGELRIVERHVKRDFNAPNIYIVNSHAGFRGGGCQTCSGRALKATTENLVHPAGPQTTLRQPKPRTRHIVVASRIGRKFCDEHGVGGYRRQPIIQRIEDALNVGREEVSILQELEQEHQARLEAAKARLPHRGTWRKRDDVAARLAAINATVTRQSTGEELARREAEDRESYTMWLGMSENFKRLNLWTGPVFEVGGGQCSQCD